MSGNDASESDVSNRIRVNLDGLNMDGIEVDELCNSDDSGRLDSAHESDSDGQNWPEFNLENGMNNLRLKVGMLFKSKDSLKEATKQYGRSRSHLSIKSHSDMLENNLSESFNKMILEARGKPILTMMETIRTKIMLLIVKKKEEADKWKGMLCPKIKKKLDVNIKDSLRPIRGPKQWASLSNMLPILPPTLRRPPGRPTKVRRKEPDEPQTTERLSKRGVDMRCSKCKRIGHNKRSCKGEVGQSIPVKRHKVGVPTQQ
ncbi:hypothetical protein GOBAR_DD22144 [Gossypium barbadense]|nr:hypothetical protein GOBAR_DD22144 [Gossypium barbadense]